MDNPTDRTVQTTDTSIRYSYSNREWNEQQFQITQANKHQQEEKKNSVELTEKTLATIYIIQKWGIFLAVFGFISATFMLFASFIMLVVKSFQQVGPFSSMLSLFYLLLGIALVVISVFLLRFSSQAKQGVDQKDSSVIESSFMQLKYFFAGSGWITIILVIFTIVMIVVAIILGVVAAAAQAVE